MDKMQDINITNNNSSRIVDENIKEVTYLLTQKVDEITGSQMKKVEVQKLEDDLTIKMLEREYLETKRNLIYSKKKLEEARIQASTQSETIHQLLQVNKEIVEKFNELKRFQNEIILINFNNAEKTHFNCKNKNGDLSSILQMIIEKENYSKFLNEDILQKKDKLNDDVQRQIMQKKGVSSSLNEILTQSNKRIEILTTQLNQETVDDSFKDIIGDKNKRVIELEADGETFQKQLNQELDDLMQMKTNKVQELDSNNKNLEEMKKLVSRFHIELLSIKENQTIQNETFENTKANKEAILKEIMNKRQVNELSKKAFDENIENINDQQDKVNTELQFAKNNFTKNEGNMHAEFEKLYAKLEEQKNLSKKLETCQHDLNKLKEAKLRKQKELSNDKEPQDKLKKLTEDFKKFEQIVLININKQIDFDAKIKELQEKRNTVKQKLESFEKGGETISENTANISIEVSQSLNSEKKIDLTYETDYEPDKDNKRNLRTPKKEIQSLTPQKKSIYTFDSDDSDEAEDEFNIRNITPKRSSSVVMPYKKPVYNLDWDTEETKNSNTNRSQSDKLFDDLLSQTPVTSPRNTDVFKVPQAYMTPIRKKSPQVKKY